MKQSAWQPSLVWLIFTNCIRIVCMETGDRSLGSKHFPAPSSPSTSESERPSRWVNRLERACALTTHSCLCRPRLNQPLCCLAYVLHYPSGFKSFSMRRLNFSMHSFVIISFAVDVGRYKHMWPEINLIFRPWRMHLVGYCLEICNKICRNAGSLVV